jgi:hypothetical protein
MADARPGAAGKRPEHCRRFKRLEPGSDEHHLDRCPRIFGLAVEAQRRLDGSVASRLDRTRRTLFVRNRETYQPDLDARSAQFGRGPLQIEKAGLNKKVPGGSPQDPSGAFVFPAN